MYTIVLSLLPLKRLNPLVLMSHHYLEKRLLTLGLYGIFFSHAKFLKLLTFQLILSILLFLPLIDLLFTILEFSDINLHHWHIPLQDTMWLISLQKKLLYMLQ